MLDVAAAIIRSKERILLTRRKAGKSLGGYWEFPGGKLEDGESLQACIEREINEELGVGATAGRTVTTSIYSYEKLTVRLHAIETVIHSDRFVLKDHDNFEWVPVSSLLEFQLAPADIPIAEHLIATWED